MVNPNTYSTAFLILFYLYSPAAKLTSTGSMPRSATFQVVHKSSSSSSMIDTFSSDQRRLNAIHAHFKNTTLPVIPGLPLIGTNEYVVSIGLGTPAKSVLFEIDTGSALTWTQCKPCHACHRQRGDMYQPSSSTTHSNISYHSSLCSELDYPQHCSTGPCIFTYKFADGSYVAGFIMTDDLKRTPTANVFPSFVFGCGQNVSGDFGEEGGILGLGRGSSPKSIVNQTSQIYGKYFSYCFPSQNSFKGHLTFGKNSANTNNVKFTPLIPHPKYYYIDILSISVGGSKLPISPLVFKAAGCIIDSGTSLTYLPPTAYKYLSASFKMQMNKFYPSVPTPYDVLDTCFVINHNKSIRIPKISFYFDGDVKVELDSSGIVRIMGSTVVCLAFAANDNDTEIAVFGNTQQKTFEVVYDVGGERLGFIPNGCN